LIPMPTDSLTVRVIDHVFDRIRQNGLSSGDTLPSQVRTSMDLKISRGIIREAFRSLHARQSREEGMQRDTEVEAALVNLLLIGQCRARTIQVRQVLTELLMFRCERSNVLRIEAFRDPWELPTGAVGRMSQSSISCSPRADVGKDTPTLPMRRDRINVRVMAASGAPNLRMTHVSSYRSGLSMTASAKKP
jgi:DNA-binding transcriptional MocR family regulator